MVLKITELVESGICALADRKLLCRRTVPQVTDTSSIVLGNDIGGQPPRPVSLSQTDRARHCYVLGATGCGKTNLLLNLISSDIEAKRTFVVIDLRGDLIDRVLGMLAATGEQANENVCFIDLRQDRQVVGFNPFLGDGEVHSRALHVLDVVKRQADSWGVQLDDTLRNCLVALAETEQSLAEVAPLLTVSSFRERVLCQINDPYASSFLSQYGELSYERQRTLALPVLNKVTPFLAVPRVRRTLGSSGGINIRKLLDSPGQVVLVSLAVDRLHGAAHLLGGLLVSCIQNAVMSRTDIQEGKRNPVSLYVDEFENFDSQSFESLIAEGRRFRLSLTLAHQNLSQLPRSLQQALRNNVCTQFYFQTGAIDASELSREVVGLGSKENVRRLLLTQSVGSAVMSRRGKPPILLRTELFQEPTVSVEALDQYLEEALAAYARSAIDVDAEMRNRLRVGSGDIYLDLRHDRPPVAARRKAQ